MAMKKPLGVLGGMGPLATINFYEKITKKTPAAKDQDHLDMVILSHASMPDRTEAILTGDDTPMQLFRDDCKILLRADCCAIVTICNTAHYFMHRIAPELPVPFISATVECCEELSKRHDKGKVAILATEGTIKTGLYRDELIERGLVPYEPKKDVQKAVNHIIYDCIKAGKKADRAAISFIESNVKSEGCDAAILGCTELSYIAEEENLAGFFVDPVDILAEKALAFYSEMLTT